MYTEHPNRHYRIIFIPDVPSGRRGRHAELRLDFPKRTDCEYLCLVGGIIDGWRLTRSWYWRQSHDDRVQKVLRKARTGTKVYYIPGNHDEGFRDDCGLQCGGVAMIEGAAHVTAGGRRFLVLHGGRLTPRPSSSSAA